jgi:hypothetical protein
MEVEEEEEEEEEEEVFPPPALPCEALPLLLVVVVRGEETLSDTLEEGKEGGREYVTTVGWRLSVITVSVRR